MDKLISIVPGPKNETGASICQGTKVLNGDGTPIEGVTRIELIAEAGEVWRAVIHTYVQPLQIDGVIDVTNLMSHSRSFVEGGYTSPMVNGEPAPSNRVVPSQLDRIEAMLGSLLEALAEDEDGEEEEPARTLDGDTMPGERDTSRSL